MRNPTEDLEPDLEPIEIDETDEDRFCDPNIPVGFVRKFNWNKKDFEAISLPCNEDDTKKILSAIVNQAVKDFERLAHPEARRKKTDKESWETARGFLFEENYTIDYGDSQLTFSEILKIIGDGSLSLTSMRRSLISKTVATWEDQGRKLDYKFYKKPLKINL